MSNVQKFEELLSSDEALQAKMRELVDAYNGDGGDERAFFEAVMAPCPRRRASRSPSRRGCSMSPPNVSSTTRSLMPLRVVAAAGSSAEAMGLMPTRAARTCMAQTRVPMSESASTSPNGLVCVGPCEMGGSRFALSVIDAAQMCLGRTCVFYPISP